MRVIPGSAILQTLTDSISEDEDNHLGLLPLTLLPVYRSVSKESDAGADRSR